MTLLKKLFQKEKLYNEYDEYNSDIIFVVNSKNYISHSSQPSNSKDLKSVARTQDGSA